MVNVGGSIVNQNIHPKGVSHDEKKNFYQF